LRSETRKLKWDGRSPNAVSISDKTIKTEMKPFKEYLRYAAGFCLAGAVLAAAHDGYNAILMNHPELRKVEDVLIAAAHDGYNALINHHESYTELRDRWAREDENDYKAIMARRDGDRYTMKRDRALFSNEYLYDSRTGKVYFTSDGEMVEVEPRPPHAPISHNPKIYLIPDISKMRDWTSTGDPQEIPSERGMGRFEKF
jgi:hypothetical protein